MLSFFFFQSPHLLIFSSFLSSTFSPHLDPSPSLAACQITSIHLCSSSLICLLRGTFSLLTCSASCSCCCLTVNTNNCKYCFKLQCLCRFLVLGYRFKTKIPPSSIHSQSKRLACIVNWISLYRMRNRILLLKTGKIAQREGGGFSHVLMREQAVKRAVWGT